LELHPRFNLVNMDQKHKWDSSMGHAVWTCSAFGKIHLEKNGFCLSGRAQPTVSDSDWWIRAGEFSTSRHRNLEE